MSKIAKVVNLHFSEMHHLRWILDKLYESTQTGLTKTDKLVGDFHSVWAQIDSIALSIDSIAGSVNSLQGRADAVEGAVVSLLANDTAMLNAASEEFAAIDHLNRNTVEKQNHLLLELKKIEDENQTSAKTIALAFEQIGGVADFASTLARLQGSNHQEIRSHLSALQESLTERDASSRQESLNLEAVRLHLSALQESLTERDASSRQESLNLVSATFNQAIGRLHEQFRSLVNRSDETGPIRVASGENEPQEPEIALAQYLYSYLPTNCAVDVGANVGHFSARLLNSGYKVVAFEPYEPTFNTLQKRLKSYPQFQAFRFGLGSGDSSMALHVASDTSGQGRFPDPTLYNSLVDHSLMTGLEFTNTVPVEVRSLETLQRDGVVPTQVGLLKVDTEGFDLEVLRGIGAGDYSVVMAEFWDGEHPFGRSGAGRPQGLINEMRLRDYPWYIVIYHLNNNETISFYCNRPQPVPGSWGNVVFFRNHEIFREARRWCEAMMRPTLFI